MRVTVAARAFDPDGVVSITLLDGSQVGDVERRVTKVRTLDQGVAINDRGFSEGDRELILIYKPVSLEHDDRVRRLIRLHPLVTVSTRVGCFEAAPLNFQNGADENAFVLTVTQRLDEG